MMKDLTNHRFGKLTAIEPTKERKYGCIIWKCICDCGRTVYLPSNWLTRGAVASCGCLQKANARQMGLHNRKCFGCMECGSDRHYAKGLCKNCYNRMRRRGELRGGI